MQGVLVKKIGTIAVACSMAAFTAYAQSQQDVPEGDGKLCYGGSLTYCFDDGKGGRECIISEIYVPCGPYGDPEDPKDPGGKDPKDDPTNPG